MPWASTAAIPTRSRGKPSATRLPTSLASLLRFWSIITCSLALVACDAAAPKFKSTDITGAEYGKSLELQDTSGRMRHLEDFRGKAVVLFFGFTHCPDVVPTSLADLAGVMKTLGPEAGRVQGPFVPRDPPPDTPDALPKHSGAFAPRLIA